MDQTEDYDDIFLLVEGIQNDVERLQEKTGHCSAVDTLEMQVSNWPPMKRKEVWKSIQYVEDVVQQVNSENEMWVRQVLLPRLKKLFTKLKHTDLDQLMENSINELTKVSGVGKSKAETLFRSGYHSIEDLQESSQSKIAETAGVGKALAARIKADVGDENY